MISALPLHTGTVDNVPNNQVRGVGFWVLATQVPNYGPGQGGSSALRLVAPRGLGRSRLLSLPAVLGEPLNTTAPLWQAAWSS